MSPRRRAITLDAREARLAWCLMAPALGVLVLVAAGPLLVTIWESFFHHDLRLPWLGRPFAGLGNYAEAAADPRVRQALAHTAGFTAVTIPLELTFGVLLALGLDSLRRGRGLARVIVLLPWALPTVVAALIWRFMFDGQAGLAAGVLSALAPSAAPIEWLAGPLTAWVPIVLADVWKTTPFVALLVLAGLQGIDPGLHEAARLDGASAFRRFVHITLPLLRPALVVALVFRTLDAFRVFDLVFVLTGGGPGTSTEVISLYAFTSLLQHLRFGYGSALSVMIFALGFTLALVYVRALGTPARGAR
jgi:ABC-type sugar transport system permease subunit